MSLRMPLTDEKGVIWGAKSADYCGNSLSFLPFMDEYDTDLGKDFPFGYDVDHRMFA